MEKSYCPFAAHMDVDCPQKFSPSKDISECSDCIDSFKSLLDEYLFILKGGSVDG